MVACCGAGQVAPSVAAPPASSLMRFPMCSLSKVMPVVGLVESGRWRDALDGSTP